MSALFSKTLLVDSVLQYEAAMWQCGSCDNVSDCNTAAETSDSAAIRVESSQGHRYSF